MKISSQRIVFMKIIAYDKRMVRVSSKLSVVRRRKRVEAGGLRMHDLQPENLLERVEVAIVVDELVAACEANGGDEAIDGSANRVAGFAQPPIV